MDYIELFLTLSPDGLSSNLAHDIAFSPEIFVAEAQKVVNDESLVTVTECIEIHVVAVFVEKEKRKPRSESVDWYNEENPDYPALLRRMSVKPQILIYLRETKTIC